LTHEVLASDTGRQKKEKNPVSCVHFSLGKEVERPTKRVVLGDASALGAFPKAAHSSVLEGQRPHALKDQFAGVYILQNEKWIQRKSRRSTSRQQELTVCFARKLLLRLKRHSNTKNHSSGGLTLLGVQKWYGRRRQESCD